MEEKGCWEKEGENGSGEERGRRRERRREMQGRREMKWGSRREGGRWNGGVGERVWKGRERGKVIGEGDRMGERE